MPAHTSMIAYYARKLENERPFVGYDQITDVMLQDGVEVLPNGLFSGTGMSSITIPSTVTKLGNDLLVDCKNLGNNMKIYYNAKNAEYTPKYDDAYNYIDPSSIPEVKDQLWLLNPWGVEKIAHVVNKLKYYDDFSGYNESTLAKMYDVVIGDGECNEGEVWEAVILAVQLKLDNLHIIVDRNQMQALGFGKDIINLNPIEDKFKTFGCNVESCDGHNYFELYQKLQVQKNGVPTVIVAHTIKGKGVSFMENQLLWHYRNPSAEDVVAAQKEVEEYYAQYGC